MSLQVIQSLRTSEDAVRQAREGEGAEATSCVRGRRCSRDLEVLVIGAMLKAGTVVCACVRVCVFGKEGSPTNDYGGKKYIDPAWAGQCFSTPPPPAHKDPLGEGGGRKCLNQK